jgi:hypothetical protein
MKKTFYYTLEDMEGHISLGANTKRLAKKMMGLAGNEGIRYKRKVGDAGYKKFAFMW